MRRRSNFGIVFTAILLALAMIAAIVFAVIWNTRPAPEPESEPEPVVEETPDLDYVVPYDISLTDEARSISMVMFRDSIPKFAQELTNRAGFAGAVAWPYADCTGLDAEKIKTGNLSEEELDTLYTYCRETVYRNPVVTYQVAKYLATCTPRTWGKSLLEYNPWLQDGLDIYEGRKTSSTGYTGTYAWCYAQYEDAFVVEQYFVTQEHRSFANKVMILWDRVFVRGNKVATTWDTTKFMVLCPSVDWDGAPCEWAAGSIHDKKPVLVWNSITKEDTVDIAVGFNTQGQNFEVYEGREVAPAAPASTPAPSRPSNPTPTRPTQPSNPTPTPTPTPQPSNPTPTPTPQPSNPTPTPTPQPSNPTPTPQPTPEPTPEPTPPQDGEGIKDPEAGSAAQGNAPVGGGPNDPENNADPPGRENQPTQGHQDPVATVPTPPPVLGDHDTPEDPIVADDSHPIPYDPTPQHPSTWTDDSTGQTAVVGGTPSTGTGSGTGTGTGTGTGNGTGATTSNPSPNDYLGEFTPSD